MLIQLVRFTIYVLNEISFMNFVQSEFVFFLENLNV